jgi:peptidoglycan/xylan/chitin deacetylase (PgdA/CDA1 family)
LRCGAAVGAKRVRSIYIPVPGYDGRPTLEPAALRDLAAEGFEIGAHGLSQCALPKFHGKELAREIDIRKRRLEDFGQRDLYALHPKGSLNRRVIFRGTTNWVAQAKRLFDRVLERCGVHYLSNHELVDFAFSGRPVPESAALRCGAAV